MVGEVCLPTNAYFPWTPDYTERFGSNSVCQNIPNFAFVYVDFTSFPEYDFWYVDLCLITIV